MGKIFVSKNRRRFRIERSLHMKLGLCYKNSLVNLELQRIHMSYLDKIL
ncbi:hypothetical protein LINPERHAP1_LOCUS29092 [Linum perenne]